MLKYFIYYDWSIPFTLVEYGQISMLSHRHIVVFNGVHEYNIDTSIQINQYRGHNIYGKNTRHNTITTNISTSIKFHIKHNIEMSSIKQLAFVILVQINKNIFKIFDTEIQFKL